jgi:hypothetical protein
MYKQEDLERMDRARLRRIMRKLIGGDVGQGMDAVDINNLTQEELIEDILYLQEFAG